MSGTPWAALLAFSAALWTAMGLFSRTGRAEDLPRFALGLVAGVGCAHLGWVLVHADRVLAEPWAILNPLAGYTVLGLPLGLLGVALSLPDRAERAAFLAAAVPALPLAIAVARLGCLAAGCCHGTASDLPWAVAIAGGGAAVHPTPLYEVLALTSLHVGVARAPKAWRAGLVVAALGGLRLALTSVRVDPPLGAPWLAPEWLALGWVAVGLVMCAEARTAARPIALASVSRPQ